MDDCQNYYTLPHRVVARGMKDLIVLKVSYFNDCYYRKCYYYYCVAGAQAVFEDMDFIFVKNFINTKTLTEL